jgi:hypothetical protein
MPWQEIKAIEQRMNFVDDVESSAESFSDRCAGYGVSRVTGYKWWNQPCCRDEGTKFSVDNIPTGLYCGVK